MIKKLRIFMIAAIIFQIIGCASSMKGAPAVMFKEKETGDTYLGLRFPTPILFNVPDGRWSVSLIGNSKFRLIEERYNAFNSIELTGIKKNVFTSVQGSTDSAFILNWLKWESDYIKKSSPGYTLDKIQYDSKMKYGWMSMSKDRKKLSEAIFVDKNENVFTIANQTNMSDIDPIEVVKEIVRKHRMSTDEEIDMYLTTYNSR